MNLGRTVRSQAGSPDRNRCGRSGWRPQPVASAQQEGGFTLVEVLVSISLLAVVLGLLMVPIVDSQRIETRDENYAYSQQEARTGVESMVAQIRQATAILSQPSQNAVVFNITLAGQALTVLYECDINQPNSPQGTTYHECVRAQTVQGGNPNPSSGTVVARNLLNGDSTNHVFSFGPDQNAPYYMTATLWVPSSDGSNTHGLTHTIVLSDGTLMRNLNVAN
jgi:prepilin-type N-terminal cleavage/methylation domain-containing protein